MPEWSEENVVEFLKLPRNERVWTKQLIDYSVDYVKKNFNRWDPADRSQTVSDLDQDFNTKLYALKDSDKELPFRVNSIGNFHAYLLRMAKNQQTDNHRIYELKRNGGGSVNQLEQPNEIAGREATPSQENMAKEISEFIQNWINETDNPVEREILRGYGLNGETAKEASERLNAEEVRKRMNIKPENPVTLNKIYDAQRKLDKAIIKYCHTN